MSNNSCLGTQSVRHYKARDDSGQRHTGRYGRSSGTLLLNRMQGRGCHLYVGLGSWLDQGLETPDMARQNLLQGKHTSGSSIDHERTPRNSKEVAKYSKELRYIHKRIMLLHVSVVTVVKFHSDAGQIQHGFAPQ